MKIKKLITKVLILSLFCSHILPYSALNTTYAAGFNTDCTDTVTTEVSQVECEALGAIYNALDGDSWINNTNWGTTGTSVKTWFGLVFVGANLTKIHLFENNLSGTLPTEIGNFSSVQHLFLSGNNITGALPTSIGNLTTLTHLRVDVNSMSGIIPTTFSNLTSLNEVRFHRNNFSGTLDSLSTQPNLNYMYLEENNFSGIVPSGITSRVNMRTFRANINHFTGPAPEFVSTGMTIYKINENHFDHLESDIEKNATISNLTWYNSIGQIARENQSFIPVTIEQSASQEDPTAVNSVTFDVTFDEAIDTSTFVGSDITFSGSTTAAVTAINEVAPNDNTSFQIVVNNLTTGDTVEPILEEGKVLTSLLVKNYKSSSIDNSVSFSSVNIDDFIITVADVESFKIPTRGSGYAYKIDCNDDGVFESSYVTGSYTCDYSSLGGTGPYTIRIQDRTTNNTGFPRIYFNDIGAHNLLSIEQWGTGKWTSMERAFFGAENMVINAIDNPDLSEVTNMDLMFKGAAKMNHDISDWDISNVTSMNNMLEGNLLFNQDIGGMDLSNVTSMMNFLKDAASFNQDVGSWDMSNKPNLIGIFAGATSFNQDISSWDTSNALYLYQLFKGATSFNQDIGNWDISNVINLSHTFAGATSFNQDIGNWDTSKVTNISSIFNGATSFNQDIGGWDTSKITTIQQAFGGATSFNQDIGNWDVSSANNFYGLFKGATSFNQDIGNWDTSSVAKMQYTFQDATSFDQDLGSWNVGLLNDATDMFKGAELSIENYDALLNGWEPADRSNTNVRVNFHGGTSRYCLGEDSRNGFIGSPHFWLITDAGKYCIPTNNSPTGLTLDNSSVAENTATGTVIGNLSTTDTDTGDTFSYTLVAGTGSEDNALFTLSGSELVLNFVPDFENPTDSGATAGNNTYSVRVQTDDGNGGTYEEVIVITVTDEVENSSPTGLTLDNSSVAENTATGTVIGNLSTTDTDTGDTFSYSLVAGTGSEDNALFTLSGSELVLNFVPDFENAEDSGDTAGNNTYSVRVQTDDGNGGTYDEVILITVTDEVENSSPTGLTLDNSSVAENTATGTVIGNLSTTDTDTGDTFSYTLVAGTGSEDNALFTLSGSELVLNFIPDYENAEDSGDTAGNNTYSVRVQTDDGNGGTYEEVVIITVTDLDDSVPVLTLVDDAVIEVSQGSDYTDAGALFSDLVDGTGAVVGSGTVDTSTLGTYTITYNYTDAAGNDAFEITRSVKVVDTTAPTAPTLVGPSNGTNLHGKAEPGTTVTLVGITSGETCTTIADAEGKYSCDFPGTPTDKEDVSVTSTDASGNSESIYVSEEIDLGKPVLTLVGAEELTIDYQSTYVELGAIFEDYFDGTGSVVPNVGSVDTGTLGEYTLGYSYTDSVGNVSETIYRNVIVADLTKATIHLNGEASISVLQGGDYTDQGAWFDDIVDGTGSIVGSGTVDTSTVGEYVISYNYTDAAGNVTDTIYRTVTVVDESSPVTVEGSLEIDAGETEVTISWETNEPTSTQIIYGLTDTTDKRTEEKDIAPRVTIHTDTLSGLQVCTQYYFYTISIDESENVTTEGIYEFLTGGCAGEAEVIKAKETNVVLNASGNTTDVPLVLENEEKVIKVEVPEGFATTHLSNSVCSDEGAFFQFKEIDKVAVEGALGTPSGKDTTVRTYDLSAYCTPSERITNFDENVTITAEYNDGEMEFVNEEDLSIHRFNEDTEQWQDLENCSVDTVGNSITCETNHFSTFGIFSKVKTTESSSRGGSTSKKSFSIECKADRHLECHSSGVYVVKSHISCIGGDLGKTCTPEKVEEKVEEEILEEELTLDSASDVEDIFEEVIEIQTEEKEIEAEMPIEKGEKGQERSIMVDGVEREYGIKGSYDHCPILKNLHTFGYEDGYVSELTDIEESSISNLILRLERAGVVDGTTDNNFEGLRDMSRIEFIKIVLRSHCIEYRNEDPSGLDFSDLDNTTWQAKVAKKALDLGVVDGDSNENGVSIFRANEKISKIEATKILMNMAIVKKGLNLTTGYTDLGEGWYENYVKHGEYLHIFDPEKDNLIFRPEGFVTRESMVDLLYRVTRLYKDTKLVSQ